MKKAVPGKCNKPGVVNLDVADPFPLEEHAAGENDIGKFVDLQEFERVVGCSYDEFKRNFRMLHETIGDEGIEALQSGAEAAVHEEMEDTVESELLLADGGRKRRRRRRGGGFSVGKAVKKGTKAVGEVVKAGAKVVSKAASHVVEKGLKWFEQQAGKAGEAILKQLGVKWDGKKYREFMFRHSKDFTGTALDTQDDYKPFNERADCATQYVVRHAFASLPHQDKCAEHKGMWREYHPTPFAEIAKNAHSPFKVYPFKAQYDNDKAGYFVEPCNAVSNGYFLTLFGMPEVQSESACARSFGPALDCIDEDHLLQIVTAGMPFGSWTMHGDGGSLLGTLLDVKGMWVQFYFLYRLVLKNFVHDEALRKHLVLPGCDARSVPDEEDGIRWVNADGERMCHLYWARQFKKLMLDRAMIQAKNDEKTVNKADKLFKGLPPMEISIASIVLIALRAVFHKNFPHGDAIYAKITDQIIGALMAKADDETKAGIAQFIGALHPNKVLGFEDPRDGVSSVLQIFADFMDAMFWQESGKFGPGTKGLLKYTLSTAGCTWMPHSVWHRKATRVIGGFVKIGKALHKKLKHPRKMTLWKFPESGVYPNIAKSIGPIVAAGVQVYNMARLAKTDFDKTKDFINLKGLVQDIRKKFGEGWPKSMGSRSMPKWPMCRTKPLGHLGELDSYPWGKKSVPNPTPKPTPKPPPPRRHSHRRRRRRRRSRRGRR